MLGRVAALRRRRWAGLTEVGREPRVIPRDRGRGRARSAVSAVVVSAAAAGWDPMIARRHCRREVVPSAVSTVASLFGWAHSMPGMTGRGCVLVARGFDCGSAWSWLPCSCEPVSRRLRMAPTHMFHVKHRAAPGVIGASEVCGAHEGGVVELRAVRSICDCTASASPSLPRRVHPPSSSWTSRDRSAS